MSEKKYRIPEVVEKLENANRTNAGFGIRQWLFISVGNYGEFLITSTRQLQKEFSIVLSRDLYDELMEHQFELDKTVTITSKDSEGRSEKLDVYLTVITRGVN